MKLLGLYPQLNGEGLLTDTGEIFLGTDTKPRSHQRSMLDLIEPKNKLIELMEDNMKMKDEKIRLLNEEVRDYRAAYMLLQEKEVNTREEAPKANH